MASHLCEAHVSYANMPVHLSQSCEDSCKTNSAESRQNATASICQITGHIIEPSPHQMLFDQLLLPHPTSLANHKLTQNPVESLSNSEVFWSRPKGLGSLFNLICQRATSCELHHKAKVTMKSKVRMIFDPRIKGFFAIGTTDQQRWDDW